MGVEFNLRGAPEFDNLQIVRIGSVTVGSSTDGNTSTISVAHGLDVIPIVLAFFDNGTSRYPLPYHLVQSSGANEGKVLQVVSWYADSTNITFFNQSNLQNNSGGEIKYYILRERTQ